MKKKNLLVCRSGGRSSEFKYRWTLANKSDEYNIVGVFANTGREHWKTLEFVHKNDIENERLFGVKPVWLEAVVHEGRVACTSREVNYATADRTGTTFENVIKKYGLPNKAYLHCTRELKENPIHHYVKSVLGWKKGDYETSLGMRIDEPKRVIGDSHMAKLKVAGLSIDAMWKLRSDVRDLSFIDGWDLIVERFAVIEEKTNKWFDVSDVKSMYNKFMGIGCSQNKVYPLIDWHPEQPDKLDILDWWEDQEFNLGIPEHLGNCTGCFKKSANKSLKVVRDHNLNWERRMEFDYGHVGPNRINGKLSELPRTMYRQYMTAEKIIALFQVSDMNKLSRDNEEESGGCSESCEAFGDS